LLNAAALNAAGVKALQDLGNGEHDLIIGLEAAALLKAMP